LSFHNERVCVGVFLGVGEEKVEFFWHATEGPTS
jgi:hypothetical protein